QRVALALLVHQVGAVERVGRAVYVHLVNSGRAGHRCNRGRIAADYGGSLVAAAKPAQVGEFERVVWIRVRVVSLQNEAVVRCAHFLMIEFVMLTTYPVGK